MMTFCLQANTLTVSSSASGSTIGGVISGTGGIVKAGDGTLTLSTPATYLGSTVIDGGTLRLGASDIIPDSSALTIGAAGTLHLDDKNEVVAIARWSWQRITWHRSHDEHVQSSAAIMRIPSSSGLISESGDAIKVGSGTMTLSGASTFDGEFQHTQGTFLS